MDTTLASDSPPLAGYQLRMPSFEGPLDVLLRLIERNQLTITDISLALVTDQFLAHVASLNDVPPEVLAEFVAMGTRLTVLKSRALLPRPATIEEEPAPSELVQQLAHYRQVQAVAVALQARQAAGANSFKAEPHTRRDGTTPSPARLAPYDAAALRRSLRRRLTSLPRPREVLHQRRIVTLREMIDRLLQLPRHAAPYSFTRVLAECQSRSEMGVAFLALLVLVRRGAIHAAQETRFGEIELRPSPLTGVPNEGQNDGRGGGLSTEERGDE